MSRQKANADPFTHFKTRHRGISFRVKADGSKTYSVYHAGRYWPVAGGEREAIAKQADLRGQSARGETPVAPAKKTFAEVAEEWLTSKRKIRKWTRQSYRDALDRILIPRFGSVKLAAITTERVASLISELDAAGLSTSSIENYLLPLRGTMAFAVRRRYIGINPCSLLSSDDRPPRRERRQDHVWSDEESDALIEASEALARRPESRYDYSPLIRTALFTGLRLGELLGLQWRDFDAHEGVLHVSRQWTRMGEYARPKTEAAVRDIPLSDEMTKFLRDLKMRSPLSGDETRPIFAARNGKPIGHRNVTRRGFEPAVKCAGIEGVSFHSMRHAFASRMIARGIPSTVLARLMGHESSVITERRYVHLFDKQRTDDAVRQAMAR